MSPKRITILAVFVLIILLMLMLRLPKHEPTTTDSSGNTASPSANPTIHPQNGFTAISTNSSPGSSLPQAATNQQPVGTAEQEKSLWNSPIYYFGKVVDENGATIQGVRVSFKIHAMNENQTADINKAGETTTDQRGIFKVEAPQGIGVMVELSHPNYYPYPSNVTGFDKRSLPKSGYFSDSEEHAQLFQMHSKGNPVPLVHREGGLHIPLNGTSANFPIRGSSHNDIIGLVQVQGMKESPDPQNSGRYDWKVTIQFPNGGVIESSNYFDFVAPVAGYANSLEIEMSKDDPNWQSHTERTAFIKLSSHYVRADISIDVFHDLFITMDYFVNPDGSPNLESDPNQVIQGQ